MFDKLIALVLALAANATIAEPEVLTEESTEIDTTVLQPYTATYSYHRPGTPAEDGVHVTWKLERDLQCECWKNSLTTHTAQQDYVDATDFDLESMLLRAMRVPTQLEDGALADIDITIKQSKVTGTVTPWAGGDPQVIDNQLEHAPMGGGADLIMPALALQPGLKVVWHTLSPDFLSTTVSAEVLSQETATVDGKEVPMWVVETDSGKGEFHIIKQPPYVLKRVFRPDGKEIFLVWEFRYFGPHQTGN